MPMAMACWPLRALAIEAASSGKLVPIATMVRPIIKGETPKFRARADAPKTNLFAPQINPINPRTIMTAARNIYRKL